MGFDAYCSSGESNDEEVVDHEACKWKLSLEALKEDIADQETYDFETARKEFLDRSYDEAEERNMSSFRLEVKKKFETYKYSGINAKVLAEVHTSNDEKVIIEKLQTIYELLEDYELQHPTDIMDRDAQEVLEFADQYSEIVGISEQELMKSWLEIRGEQLEWDKLQKLINFDDSAEIIYAQVEAGEEVGWEELYDQYSYVITDVEDQEQELDDLDSELNEERTKNEQSDLEDQNTPSTLEEIVNNPNFVGQYSLSPNGDRLIINGLGEMRANIQLTDDGYIEISDDFDRIVIDLTDAIELSETLELYKIKTIFLRMVERDQLLVESQFRNFFFGAPLAKFAAHIASEQISIRGADLDWTHEIEAIYKALLNMPSEKILQTSSQLKDYEALDYERLARELDL